nr:hypothetical protein [Deltaproteobacteria bacterium]
MSSLSITASAVDSATDSVASLVLYVGLKSSNQKTSVFPSGLYKIENLFSVVMASFICVLSVGVQRQTYLSWFMDSNLTYIITYKKTKLVGNP